LSVFIDTNILIYSFDRLDEVKHQIAVDLLTELVEKNEIIVSTQVINEFIVVMTSKVTYPLSLKTVELHINKFSQVFNIRPIQMTDCTKALLILKRYGFNYWDSLIVAAALKSGCSTLYTEDVQDGQIIEKKLKIVNPFS
jgi:predicted nucleic acid-binding protein